MGAVGVSGEGEDFGMGDEAVDHRCRDDIITECLAPATEGQVAGDRDRALLVTTGDELEESQ